MSEWQPVTNGEIINSAGDVLAIYTGADGAHFLESHTDAGVAKYNLLGELMVCKRVDVEPEQMQCNTCNGFGYVEQPDEPITPEALEREGWGFVTAYRSQRKKLAYMKTHSGVEVDYVISTGWVQLEQEDADGLDVINIPNCKTMPQLRALVEMLGGGQ